MRNRELYFPNYYFYADRRLKNHNIKTEVVQNLDDCEWLCYLHDDCVSVNIKKEPDSSTGLRECELNNSTHMEYGWDLKGNDRYFYRGAEVIKNFNVKKCFFLSVLSRVFIINNVKYLETSSFVGWSLLM